jgi:hypothetical protein
MTRLVTLSVLVLTALTLTLPLFGYTVVNTSAPQINCVFTTASPCSVSGTDMVSTLPNGGKVQSRVFQSSPYSAAAGKWVYEYRLIMTDAYSYGYPPYISGMSIWNWGTVSAHDYNFDGTATDQVFNITSGGLGVKGVASAYAWWGTTYFNLSAPVYAGSAPGYGESSYFFGLVSPYAPATKSATVQIDDISGGSATVNVYAPNVP